MSQHSPIHVEVVAVAAVAGPGLAAAAAAAPLTWQGLVDQGWSLCWRTFSFFLSSKAERIFLFYFLA